MIILIKKIKYPTFRRARRFCMSSRVNVAGKCSCSRLNFSYVIAVGKRVRGLFILLKARGRRFAEFASATGNSDFVALFSSLFKNRIRVAIYCMRIVGCDEVTQEFKRLGRSFYNDY